VVHVRLRHVPRQLVPRGVLVQVRFEALVPVLYVRALTQRRNPGVRLHLLLYLGHPRARGLWDVALVVIDRARDNLGRDADSHRIQDKGVGVVELARRRDRDDALFLAHRAGRARAVWEQRHRRGRSHAVWPGGPRRAQGTRSATKPGSRRCLRYKRRRGASADEHCSGEHVHPARPCPRTRTPMESSRSVSTVSTLTSPDQDAGRLVHVGDDRRLRGSGPVAPGRRSGRALSCGCAGHARRTQPTVAAP
jgi:hypothetical protein